MTAGVRNDTVQTPRTTINHSYWVSWVTPLMVVVEMTSVEENLVIAHSCVIFRPT